MVLLFSWVFEESPFFFFFFFCIFAKTISFMTSLHYNCPLLELITFYQEILHSFAGLPLSAFPRVRLRLYTVDEETEVEFERAGAFKFDPLLNLKLKEGTYV